MEITLFKSESLNFLVVGSNGNIGSEIVTRLRNQPQNFPPVRSWISAKCEPVNYPRIAKSLLLYQNISEINVDIFFAAGRGGFGLIEQDALVQLTNFTNFCRSLQDSAVRLRKFYLISSLGAHRSKLSSIYSTLCNCIESEAISQFGSNVLILRLPSIYGFNQNTQKYHGLVGQLLADYLSSSV